MGRTTSRRSASSGAPSRSSSVRRRSRATRNPTVARRPTERRAAGERRDRGAPAASVASGGRMNELEDRTVVVVGAGSGIGLATARAAAALGARVILAGRTRSKLEDAARASGLASRAVPMDMLDASEVDRVMASIGAVDHIVLAAAGDELASVGGIRSLTGE